jgi:hypothetical protein
MRARHADRARLPIGRLLVVGVAVTLGVTVAPVPAFAAPATVRISSGPDGGPGLGFNNVAAVNADGRYVTFASSAGNLVPGDTNATTDVFLRDRVTGAIERVSVSSAGAQADSYSYGPADLSADGRYVVFASAATNLVDGDVNGQVDIFIRDRKARTTKLVSRGSTGAQGNDTSFGAAVSANGRYVAFGSFATNLVAGDTNGKRDVFIRDLKTHRTRLVSGRHDGRVPGNGESTTPLISDDGRYVGFLSTSTNLVPGVTNTTNNAYVKDLRDDTLDMVSVDSAGKQFYSGPAEMSMSADGRLVSFVAFELVPYQPQVYVRDRKLRTTVVASVGADGTPSNGGSARVSMSASGRYVAFQSGAHNLLPNTPFFELVYVRDLKARTTTLAGITGAGGFIQGHQSEPAMSDGGVAFRAEVPNIVSGGDDSANPFQVYFRSL